MTALPIDAHLPAITAALRDRGALVLVAEPGAGKTTRVPPAILDAGLLDAANPRLVMLQPRRVAARAAAERIAEERGVPLGGDDVGYHVRFDRRLTDATRLRVLTEGILTRQLVGDPFLEGVGCVLLDEFHERSLDVDLAIALLREVRQSVRPDLKLVVMSATLDAASVADFLADARGPAPIVNVPGRTFPVEVEYRLPSERRLWERVVDEVERARAMTDMPTAPRSDPERGPAPDRALAPDGSDSTAVGVFCGRASRDVLVFLPGAYEIDRCARALAPLADRLDFDVRPLHGSLPFADQQLALRPGPRPKVVLATNIAETSLTIDGVTLVIDAGLARVPRFDPRRGLDRLELKRISRASATQRAGRAGRTGPGRCVRLWTSREQAAMDAFEVPEVRRVDLAPTVLSLRAWGTGDPRGFGWFDAPDEPTLAQAEGLLAMLGATEGPRGSITDLGRQLASLPVHPRIGRVLLAGVAWGEAALACTYAAILSERDFVRDDDAWANRAPRTTGASDLAWRAQLLDGDGRADFIDREAWRSARRVRDELTRVAARLDRRRPQEPGRPRADPISPEGRGRDVPAFVEGDDVALLLAVVGYPDRVCRRRGVDAGTLVGGGGVRLHPSSVCREGELFVALDARADERSRTREASVRLASRVERAWLERLFPRSVTRERAVAYDGRAGRVVARRRTTFGGDLPLDESPDALRPDDDVAAALAAGLRAAFDAGEVRSEGSAQLAARLAMLATCLPAHLWPPGVTRGAGAGSLLEAACALAAAAGEPTREGVVARLDAAARDALDYPLRRLLDEHAPESIEVPTGSRIALDWSAADAARGRGPVMAVRLQELFSVARTPLVCGGAAKVVLHLLGPNHKPVQVTDDLASFWAGTYARVRKELRARYPKHSWPDDPLVAEAIRGPRRRGAR